ncbi:MAG: hypothetical protein QMC74_19455 [Myxococcota bacterium]
MSEANETNNCFVAAIEVYEATLTQGVIVYVLAYCCLISNILSLGDVQYVLDRPGGLT